MELKREKGLSKEVRQLAREILVNSLAGAMTLNHGSNTLEMRHLLTSKQFESAVKCSIEAAQLFYRQVDLPANEALPVPSPTSPPPTS
jgi:hypothetical protein